MNNFIVFVKHAQETDLHLYEIRAPDLETAEFLVRQAFNKKFAPDEEADWYFIGFTVEPGFTPTYLTRLDKGL